MGVPDPQRIVHQGYMSQLDMFGSLPKPAQTLPTADSVRPELTALLTRLRVSETMPLSPKDLRFWRTVFPQMSRWLPEDERNAMCASFVAELARLESRAA
ncbi:hypothetical protein [Phenylobacterium immobile]|uniref:hypothetical protein n=1 Tax=Phenylobacterium immobile TaxID=21 RepID=UPI00159EDA3F|nr:hypothetical protein [Phenylobacterium immobile]